MPTGLVRPKETRRPADNLRRRADAAPFAILPAPPPVVPQTLAQLCPAMTSVMRRVLLVDDEDPVRNVLRRYLELRGWAVIEATSAEEALVILDTEADSVGVVVVDFHLPGLSGGALCRRSSPA